MGEEVIERRTKFWLELHCVPEHERVCAYRFEPYPFQITGADTMSWFILDLPIGQPGSATAPRVIRVEDDGAVVDGMARLRERRRIRGIVTSMLSEIEDNWSPDEASAVGVVLGNIIDAIDRIDR